MPTATWTDAGAAASGDEAAGGTADVARPVVHVADAVAADGLLVHGSINNSAASPFAQSRLSQATTRCCVQPRLGLAWRPLPASSLE